MASIDVNESLMRRCVRLGVAFLGALRPWPPAAAGNYSELVAGHS